MLLILIGVGTVAFLAGWILKDQKWKRAAKNGKIMVVDGDMYKVKRYEEEVIN